MIYVQKISEQLEMKLMKRHHWKVHSIFKNGLNLISGKELLFIGTDKNGELPFAVHLSFKDTKEILKKVNIGDPFTYDPLSKQLQNKQFILAFDYANHYHSRLSQQKEVNLKQVTKVLNEAKRVQDRNGFGEKLPFSLVYLEQMETSFSQAVKGLVSEDEEKTREALLFFIGRGKGLTPSGDDLLVGLLSVDSAYGLLNQNVRLLITELLETTTRTTAVAETYLRYAINHLYSTTILSFLKETSEEYQGNRIKTDFHQLLTNGSTSGLDTMTGILLGLLMLKKERNTLMGKRVVIALGGNAILRPNQEATFENQLKNVEISTDSISDVKKAGHQVIVTHGNGPQVGNILRQNEEAKDVVPQLPLDALSAQSQGFIGYMMEQSLKNALTEKDISGNVVTLLTETEVDANDTAFNNPTKPIGVFYTEEEAKQLEQEKGWNMAEDAGRGYRRVVASPQPQKIHGVSSIKALLENDTVVISTGGGGIPVVADEKGLLKGIEAVIDKDLSGLRLAEQVDADVFMILTDVSNVYLNYGKPDQKKLETVTLAEANQYVTEGHFAAGSMGPKMEAAIAFAAQGKEAIICSLENAVDALAGTSGTRIVAN